MDNGKIARVDPRTRPNTTEDTLDPIYFPNIYKKTDWTKKYNKRHTLDPAASCALSREMRAKSSLDTTPPMMGLRAGFCM